MWEQIREETTVEKMKLWREKQCLAKEKKGHKEKDLREAERDKKKEGSPCK